MVYSYTLKFVPSGLIIVIAYELNDYLQDNAGVIVNPKGEMKGSAITGPVAKECVRCLPSTTFLFTDSTLLITGRLVAAYCIECWYGGITSAASLLFPRHNSHAVYCLP